MKPGKHQRLMSLLWFSFDETAIYSWVSGDVTSFAEVGVRHVGVPSGVKFMNN